MGPVVPDLASTAPLVGMEAGEEELVTVMTPFLACAIVLAGCASRIPAGCCRTMGLGSGPELTIRTAPCPVWTMVGRMAAGKEEEEATIWTGLDELEAAKEEVATTIWLADVEAEFRMAIWPEEAGRAEKVLPIGAGEPELRVVVGGGRMAVRPLSRAGTVAGRAEKVRLTEGWALGSGEGCETSGTEAGIRLKVLGLESPL